MQVWSKPIGVSFTFSFFFIFFTFLCTITRTHEENIQLSKIRKIRRKNSDFPNKNHTYPFNLWSAKSAPKIGICKVFFSNSSPVYLRATIDWLSYNHCVSTEVLLSRDNLESGGSLVNGGREVDNVTHLDDGGQPPFD